MQYRPKIWFVYLLDKSDVNELLFKVKVRKKIIPY